MTIIQEFEAMNRGYRFDPFGLKAFVVYYLSTISSQNVRNSPTEPCLSIVCDLSTDPLAQLIVSAITLNSSLA